MTLILAATPLGNPGDASPRLKSAIENASIIAAEDSRRFHRLCADIEVTFTARVLSFFEGNEIDRTRELISELKSGATVLVVSDAGMPTISDPGFRLMRDAIAEGIEVSVIPGPSAVTMSVALSGLPTDRFSFEGFPPRTAGARLATFEKLRFEERTMVFFEAPHRIIASLTDAGSALGLDRNAAVCREMSKNYEEVVRGPISELITWAKSKEILGEITVVIEGFDPSSRQFSVEDLIKLVLAHEDAGESRKSAIALVAKENSVSKRVVFDAMVTHKSEDKI